MNPDQIIGGIAVEFKFAIATCPAGSGGSVRARLVGGSAAVEIPAEHATGIGTTWTLLIPGELTADLSGSYTLLVLATPSDGTETLAANLAVQIHTGLDLRSHACKTLEAIDALLEGKATNDQTAVSYNGRSISRLSWEELQNAADRLRRQIQRESDRAAGKKRIKSVQIGFKNG